MSKITQNKRIPGQHWELDGQLLHYNDWIEMKHRSKWMLARINKDLDDNYIAQIENGDNIKLCAGIEAKFIAHGIGDIRGQNFMVKWLLEERASALRKLSERLQDAKTLTICDLYFLVPTRNVMDMDELMMVLPLTTLRELEIVCSERNRLYSYQAENNLRFRLEPRINIQIFRSDSIHDRIWIVDGNKAYSVGTSFNGIGGKLSLLLDVPDSDLPAINRQLQRIKQGEA
jgi:hypothetical protein